MAYPIQNPFSKVSSPMNQTLLGAVRSRLQASWLLAAVLAAPAAHALTVGASTVTRTSSFTYTSTGLIQSETVEPSGATDVKLTTNYVYDARGNRTSATVSGHNGTTTETRQSTTTYDTQGRLPRVSTNALSHSETREYDPRFGAVTQLVGPNGLMTRWEYDEFGRKTMEKRGYASATATTYIDHTRWSYVRCVDVGGCASVQGAVPVYYVMAEVQTVAGAKLAPTTKVYYDNLNREIRTESEMLRGGAVVAVYKDTVYNASGQVDRVSNPYFAGQTAYWTQYYHDLLGRRDKEVPPNGTLTQITYSAQNGQPRTVTTVNASSADGGPRSKTVVQNSLGHTTEVIDALNGRTSYVHDAKGNLTHVEDALGNVIEQTYDIRGRKKTMKDPDMGSWSYTYNAFGELIGQRDAKNQTTTFVYDKLGRVKTRTEPDLTSQFEYDTGTKAVGKLTRSWISSGYCRMHTYDSLGRPDVTKVGYGGASACTAPTDPLVAGSKPFFESRAEYDSAGRVSHLSYPTGVRLQHVYNTTLGFLQSVQDVSLATPKVHWTWQESEAAGRMTRYVYGNNVATLKTYDPAMGSIRTLQAGTGGVPTAANVQSSGYQYDSLNNLKERADRFELPNLVERVDYDKLGRLQRYARYNGSTEIAGSAISLTYDLLGNIKTKSDVGTYTYNASGASSVRPHAVASVTGVRAASYVYDANGNMTSGAGRTLAYTSYNMVREVGNASTCQKFVYQGEHMRYQQDIYNLPCTSVSGATTPAARTLYLHPDAANGLSFEREVKGATTTYKHFINAGGMVVGVLSTTTPTVTTTTPRDMRYFHYDHLGSVVAVTDASGAVSERRSFDPWGRPRKTDGAPGNGELLQTGPSHTDRGFTLHEHLEGLDLIHMNGRVYDPMLARFVSADPFIQLPYDSQSYNRYSYVMNDPLDATDPSGYFLKWLERKVRREWKRSSLFRGVATVVAAAFAQGWMTAAIKEAGSAALTEVLISDISCEFVLSTAGKVVVGAASGAAAGFVGSTGDVEAALRAGIVGGAFGAVGAKLPYNEVPVASLTGHALVGCAASAMEGGQCGPGAASALVGKLATNHIGGNNLTKGVAATVAGGIGAEISGGSFKNGAVTAAFGYLFNFLLHREVAVNRAGYGAETYDVSFSDLDPSKSAIGSFLVSSGGGVYRLAVRMEGIVDDIKCWGECYGTRDLSPEQAARAIKEVENGIASMASRMAKANGWSLHYLTRSQVTTLLDAFQGVPGFTRFYGTTTSIMQRFPERPIRGTCVPNDPDC